MQLLDALVGKNHVAAMAHAQKVNLALKALVAVNHAQKEVHAETIVIIKGFVVKKKELVSTEIKALAAPGLVKLAVSKTQAAIAAARNKAFAAMSE